MLTSLEIPAIICANSPNSRIDISIQNHFQGLTTIKCNIIQQILSKSNSSAILFIRFWQSLWHLKAQLMFMNQKQTYKISFKSCRAVLLLVLRALSLVFWQQFCYNCRTVCPEKQLVIIAIFSLIFFPNCNRDGTPWAHS